MAIRGGMRKVRGERKLSKSQITQINGLPRLEKT